MPESEAIRNCGTCHHFDGKNSEDTFCRAHPPTVIVLQQKVRRYYPGVHPTADRCGEHETTAEFTQRKKL